MNTQIGIYVNFYLLVLFHLLVLHLILAASIRKIFNSDVFVSADLYLKFLKFSYCYEILVTNFVVLIVNYLD
jgi:hypothetical protein